MAPRPEPPVAASPGALLQLIRAGRARTRSELVAVTGLARSTVAQRVEVLLGHDLIREAGEGPSTGGRPPLVLEFNRDGGLVLAADLGATHARLGVTDLAGRLLAHDASDLDIATGPDAVLEWLDARFRSLLAGAGHDPARVRGIGIGLPGPVEFATGRPVSPPIMPGWDGVAVGDRLARWGVPVLVDNDVNVMALGEYDLAWRDRVDDLLFVKVGTGIGCGMVLGGRLHRGAQGAAGDIGHVRVVSDDDARCRCGNVGCVEAVAGGGALARRLRDLGHDDAQASPDVVRLVREGEPDALRLVREAGRQLGEVLASAVNLLNPEVIVLGGEVANAHEQLLAGVREVVYKRSLPLATRHLRLVRSETGDDVGVRGAAALVIDHLLDPAAVDAAIGGQLRVVGA